MLVNLYFAASIAFPNEEFDFHYDCDKLIDFHYDCDKLIVPKRFPVFPLPLVTLIH